MAAPVRAIFGRLLRLVSQSVCGQTTFRLYRLCGSMAQPYRMCTRSTNHRLCSTVSCLRLQNGRVSMRSMREAGMGKSTVAAAVLQELHDQNVSVAFVTFEMPGQLNLEVATALQTTPDRLSHDLHGALLQLKDRGFRKAVLVIDALDEHELTSADEETIKALAGVSWKLLRHHIDFAVICLIRKLETKKRFAQMNGGHKITGGLATEACPNVSTETLRSYASRLNATGNFKKAAGRTCWPQRSTHCAYGALQQGQHSKSRDCPTDGQGNSAADLILETKELEEVTPIPSFGSEQYRDASDDFGLWRPVDIIKVL